MRRRPLSLFCLAVILFLFLGTKLTAPAPSGFESREGEWVELTGSALPAPGSERRLPAAGGGRYLLFEIQSGIAGDGKHRAGERKAEML